MWLGDGSCNEGYGKDGDQVTKSENYRESYLSGLKVRQKVMGASHVEQALGQASDFSLPIQQLVTEYAWGEIWGRPGLDLKTRSMLNLAMLTALNRSHELAGHVRGALNNGVTEQEIQEVLLQTMIYCGAPAALESFRTAEGVITEFRRAQGAVSL
jgi:4-carboxymuconolactone decarboxylase